jgi:quinol monooxygenase YgiN
MSEEVAWLVELVIKPGQLDNFRALTREMVKFSRREAGVLTYERFVSDDGNFVYAYERYANSAAAVAHLRTFEQIFSRRFLGMADRRRFTVLGAPTEELRKLLDRFGATYLRLLD